MCLLSVSTSLFCWASHWYHHHHMEHIALLDSAFGSKSNLTSVQSLSLARLLQCILISDHKAEEQGTLTVTQPTHPQPYRVLTCHHLTFILYQLAQTNFCSCILLPHPALRLFRTSAQRGKTEKADFKHPSFHFLFFIIQKYYTFLENLYFFSLNNATHRSYLRSQKAHSDTKIWIQDKRYTNNVKICYFQH